LATGLTVVIPSNDGDGEKDATTRIRVAIRLTSRTNAQFELPPSRARCYQLSGRYRHRVRPDQIGKPLQRPLGDSQGTVSQRYRGQDGMPKDVSVEMWRSTNSELMSQLQERRSSHRPVASRLAQQLKAIRQETEQRLRRQSEGRLDRRHVRGQGSGGRLHQVSSCQDLLPPAWRSICPA
jgi:hypothetical protein